jgi:general L-amino acid transport system substrate-binding protein
MKRILTTIACAIGFFLIISASAAQTLNTIKARGFLHCGSNTGVAGFGIADRQGNWTGFDVEFCRALAAAIFDDPNKVKFIPTTGRTVSPRCNPATLTFSIATRPGRWRATPPSG